VLNKDKKVGKSNFAICIQIILGFVFPIWKKLLAQIEKHHTFKFVALLFESKLPLHKA